MNWRKRMIRLRSGRVKIQVWLEGELDADKKLVTLDQNIDLPTNTDLRARDSEGRELWITVIGRSGNAQEVYEIDN
jgi:hypothetical protein